MYDRSILSVPPVIGVVSKYMELFVVRFEYRIVLSTNHL